MIAHDFMETFGGAERAVAEMAAVFPHAPVLAITGRRSIARRMGVEDRFGSLLPPRPALLEHYRLLTPLLPTIVDRFELPEADVLLTSSYAFAHRLSTINNAPQVCYCHSPLRFAWSMSEHYRRQWSRGPASGLAFDALAKSMRRSDRAASRRVDRYLASSRYCARQVAEAYGRRAKVVGPPVDTGLFRPSDGPLEDFFLFSGRLIEPYKQPTIVVEAFRQLGRRLLVAGDGPELKRLRAEAPPNVEFLGRLSDADLVWHMQRCQATIFPSRDDFGLIPVEVAACGRPVIAYAGGGALETVVEGKTGEYITEQTVSAVVDAVRSFRPEHYDRAVLREHAEQWSKEKFASAILESVRDAAEGKPTPP